MRTGTLPSTSLVLITSNLPGREVAMLAANKFACRQITLRSTCCYTAIALPDPPTIRQQRLICLPPVFGSSPDAVEAKLEQLRAFATDANNLQLTIPAWIPEAFVQRDEHPAPWNTDANWVGRLSWHMWNDGMICPPTAGLTTMFWEAGLKFGIAAARWQVAARPDDHVIDDHVWSLNAILWGQMREEPGDIQWEGITIQIDQSPMGRW